MFHIVPTKCLIFSLSEIFVVFWFIQIVFIHTRCLGVNFLLNYKPWSYPNLVPLGYPMSSKKKKLSSKKSLKIGEPSHAYDQEKFVNESAVEKFGLISKNLSFIKEKGFHHPEDFFCKTIANKGWKALCQPPRTAATMVVHEFYANLAANVLKKV